MTTMKKIGFLFNHDAEHQVAHIAPVIGQLRSAFPSVKAIVLVSSVPQLDRILEIIGADVARGIEIRRLETPSHWQFVFRLLNTLGPAQRFYILKRYSSCFADLDCLVVPETTSTLLKSQPGLKTLPLVLLPHGAGDRAIGFGREIRHFDYVLLSGPKVRDRMLSAGLIRMDNHTLVGYPKFDTIDPEKNRTKLSFNNTNPVVLYNPHFDPQLSSWYDMGLDVLEFFADRPQYNLILAPHVMLFKKQLHVSLQSRFFKFRRRIPEKYWHCPNIKIDLGSRNCTNMNYTLNADVYLGDVSSQVYEFLYEPRPCIFLNGHQANWMENQNYRHWLCGPVLDNVSDLSAILDNLEASHKIFRDFQLQIFAETFDLQAIPSSLRAAQSIVAFMDAG